MQRASAAMPGEEPSPLSNAPGRCYAPLVTAAERLVAVGTAVSSKGWAP